MQVHTGGSEKPLPEKLVNFNIEYRILNVQY
jgi:hypothetical protein